MRDRDLEYFPADPATANRREAKASGRLRRSLARSRRHAGPAGFLAEDEYVLWHSNKANYSWKEPRPWVPVVAIGLVKLS